VTHSYLNAQAWWQVDLGQVGSVESVRLNICTDCCGTRLSNFHVFVSASDMSGRTLAELSADPTVAKVLVATLAGEPSVTLPLVATGRYVKLQLVGSDYLSLAEVRVLGR
jgi:large repetitive protein